MKKVFTLLAAFALTFGAFSQVPEKMSYQAVVRNPGGELVKNTNIGIQVSILQGSETGTAVYVETHSKTTNENGLITLEIGSGTIVSGTFASIVWSSGSYFLKTEIDVSGGASYSITGVSQILSVPYALHAKTAETAVGAVKYYDATQSVIGNNSSVINTGTRNLFIGKSSGMSTTTGSYNTFIGSEAGLNNNVGANNIAIGQNALRENDEGSENIAIGSNALEKNKVTTPGSLGGPGFQNIAIGMNAMRNAVSNMNIAIGTEVLQSVTSGIANTGIGQHVMRNVVTGGSNVAIGYMSMIDAGSNINSNVAIGVRSGQRALGSGNVFIGHESGESNKGSGNIFIGNLSGFGSTWENLNNRLIINNADNDHPLIFGEFDNSKVVINGSITVTNGINASNKTITNVSDPVNSTDAATKAYVDSKISPHYVGELYGGGVVFWIDQTGNHGLICSMIDLTVSTIWSDKPSILIGATAQSDWDGQSNTNAIVAQSTATSAADLCNDYTNLDYGTGTYSDWYLPSRGELNDLWNNIKEVQKALDNDGNAATTAITKNYYWSSTEINNTQAWYFDFNIGSVTLHDKNFGCWVRAIRAF